MATPRPVQFDVTESGTTTVRITAADGESYEVRLAILVANVVDTGLKNPLDAMPVFQIASQVVLQTKKKP